LGASAVADLMAAKYNVSKGDVLTGEGRQSAAVRLALGETQIVAETKKFLEDEGIRGAIHQFLRIIFILRILVLLPVSTLPM
jgi:hypothetical protein